MRRKGRDEEARFRLFPVFYISLGCAFFAMVIHILCARLQGFADFMAIHVGHPIRALLGYLSALFPCSLVETLILSSPILLGLLVFLAHRASKESHSASKMLSVLLSVPLLLYTLFVFSFASGYYATPLGDRLVLEEEEPNAENLNALALHLASRADEYAREAGGTVTDDGSKMPFSYAEMNRKLIAAYNRVEEKYGIVKNFSVATKPVALSRPMAYTHITGVYTYMTGEMNVCTAYPDFSTAFTAAHEMAHARGIAREDEANFVAFLVLEASDDPYLKYAAYMNLLQYVLNDFYDVDPIAYKAAWSTYSDTVIAEIRAYNRVAKQFSGSVASEIAGSINNAYLESMGTGGSVSYNLVVRLAVRYFS